MKIEILDADCPKYKATEGNVRIMVKEIGLKA
jgi:hypothetical protein